MGRQILQVEVTSVPAPDIVGMSDGDAVAEPVYIDDDDKLESIEKFEQSNKKSTINLVQPRRNFAQVRTYKGFPVPLARYAVTLMATSPDLQFICDHTQSLGAQPSTMSIATDVNEVTNVIGNSMAVYKDGVVSSYTTDSGVYVVEMSSWTEEGLDKIVASYVAALEKGNFYRGKCMQFRSESVEFINRPTTKIDDVVLPPAVKKNFHSNVIGFITNPKMQQVTKKRGIILAGNPGTGKTSLVRAAFNAVEGTDVSCIFVAGDAFRDRTLYDLVSFISTYLTPCIVVLEDFDLIAYDRSMGNSAIMGDMLSCLDGVEHDFGAIAVIGTTNRLDILDEAVTRPGRFDRRIIFTPPSADLLRAMWVSKQGPGEPPSLLEEADMTGAHVEEIIKTANMLAVEDNKAPIDCVAEAVEIVRETFLLQKPSLGFNRK